MIVKSLRGSRQDRRGVAAVELAILLPFLVFMFLIAFDWARIFYFTITVENCARNGAYYASDPYAQQSSPYTSIEDAAWAEAADLNPKPTITSTNGTDADGNSYVEVTAVWQYSTVTNFPGIPSSASVSRTVRMRVVPTTPNP